MPTLPCTLDDRFETAPLHTYMQKLIAGLLNGAQRPSSRWPPSIPDVRSFDIAGKAWDSDKDRLRALIAEIGDRVKERCIGR